MEERLYRHRCVEAWAMAVPWTGVPLAKLVNFARPQAGAKYIKFETFEDKNIAPGQRQVWYPWPYVEGLTIDEATNPLAFLTTGIYGKPCRTERRACPAGVAVEIWLQIDQIHPPHHLYRSATQKLLGRIAA